MNSARTVTIERTEIQKGTGVIDVNISMIRSEQRMGDDRCKGEYQA